MKYPLLDPLRGVAALWVFLGHFPFSPTFRSSCGGLIEVFRIGYLGVPMFFVISGYCILASARSSLRHSEPAGGFLFRRCVRILPPFWCSILVVASVAFLIEGLSSLKTGAYTPPSADHPNLRYIGYGVGDWVRMVTLTQVFVPEPGATTLQEKFTGLNAVYWTLALEVQFYVVVAVAAASRRRFYPVLALVTLAGLALAAYPPSFTMGVFLPYWPQFAAGCAVFWAVESGRTADRVFGRWSRVVAWGAVVAAAAALAASAAAGSVNHTAFALSFAVLLWLNKTPAAGDDECVRPRPVRWLWAGFGFLGLISYSLYLLHGRVQYLVQTVVRQVLPLDSIGCDAAVIAGTCGLAYLFYLACEAPFLRASQRARRAAPAVPRDAAAAPGDRAPAVDRERATGTPAPARV